ncbi:MAG: TIR domain-containing protein [Planctomycetes bacterium]|nr:TIR domain-containing protein [Planctomycetota bacterium]
MSKAFDVFLSHNSADKPAVRDLGNLLKTRQISVWLDEWELQPGRRWQDELEALVEKVRSVAVLIGNRGFGPWQDVEMQAFLSESVSKGLPIIPVLLPEAPIDVHMPYFIRAFTWVDCRDGFSDTMIDRLVWGITGRKPRTSKLTSSVGSPTKISIEVTSELNKRGRRIPFRVFREGGFEHYQMRISLAAVDHVLNAVTDVEYHLHRTFKQPRRVSTDRETNFAIDIWTYAGFEVNAVIRFADGSTVKKTHSLELDLPDDNGSNYVDESRLAKRKKGG